MWKYLQIRAAYHYPVHVRNIRQHDTEEPVSNVVRYPVRTTCTRIGLRNPAPL